MKFVACAAAIGLAFVVSTIVAWALGLRLARYRDDPTLVDRVTRYRASTWGGSLLIGLGCAYLTVLWLEVRLGAHFAAFAVVVVITSGLGGAIGRLPAMQRLHDDPEPTGRAVIATLRYFAAASVSAIAIAVVPNIVAASGSWRWAVATLAAIAFLVHARFSSTAFVRLLGVEPFEDPKLRAVETGARCESPIAGCFGLARSGLVNAFAVDARPRPYVLFTRRLLHELDDDEVVAIHAHELAHLEEPEVRRSRTIRRTMSILGIVASFGFPALSLLGPWYAVAFLWSWILVVVGLLFMLGRNAQHHESHCDARAIELGADPRALIRGLTALYRANFMPRRIAATTEVKSSHPSLARRIRDLEALAGIVAEPTVGAVEVQDARVADRSVSFDAGTMEWRERGRTTTLAYNALREMRVVLRRGRSWLQAWTSRGRRHRIQLRNEDVERVQRVLDRVDGQFAFASSAGRVSLAAFVALVSALGAFFATGWIFAEGHGALVVLGAALLGILVRVSEWPFATGVMIAQLAVVALVGSHGWPAGFQWATLGVAMAGAFTVWLAWRARFESRMQRRASLWAIAALACAQVVAVLPFGPWRALDLIASNGGLAFVLATGAGAALALHGRAKLRFAGMALVVFGFGQTLCETELFQRRLVADPWFVEGAPGSVTERPATIVHEVRYAGRVVYMSVAPDGHQVLCRVQEGVQPLSWVVVDDRGSVRRMDVQKAADFYRASTVAQYGRVRLGRKRGTLLPKLAPSPSEVLWSGPDGWSSLGWSTRRLELYEGASRAVVLERSKLGTAVTSIDVDSGATRPIGNFGHWFDVAASSTRVLGSEQGAVVVLDLLDGSTTRLSLPFAIDESTALGTAADQIVVGVSDDVETRLVWID
ncbi:MAG: M48 family metalloprotease [Planctomycetes bacterium]|nr:M48 family metalloprotease [Planctomycetota bacterium]